jgi:hypothetical protein
MLAAWKGHLAVCEFLVELGADVHAQEDVRNHVIDCRIPTI